MTENKFDGLTIKCIEEIPFLVDVLVSTGKDIEQTFSSYYDNLQQLIKERIKPKRYWKINEKESPKVLYYPIIQDNSRKIISLSNHFDVTSEIYLEKRKGNGIVKNAFGVSMGFWYGNIDATDIGPQKRFYFYLCNYSTKDTFNDLSFYKKIKENNPTCKFLIIHPESDPEYAESIEIYCEEIDTNMIDEIYKVFKEKVIIPFIENMK